MKSLKTMQFERRTLQEKLSVKELGPDQPNIVIEQQTHDRGRRFQEAGLIRSHCLQPAVRSDPVS